LAWLRTRTTLKVDGATTTLSVVKHYVGGFGHRHRLVLLDADETQVVLDGLKACKLETLHDPRKRSGRDLYHVTWRGMGAGEVRRDDPHGRGDGRLSACLGVLETAVDAHVGSVPWRDVFYDASEMGHLRAESTPAARLFVDGEDTGEVTPVAALPLRVGVHRVEFVSEGLRRHYEIRILPGATTNLDVDLR
jgi:hypothetical protein